MSASVSTLGDTGWLIHVQSVLAGAAWIAGRIALESASVLVHCRSEVFFMCHSYCLEQHFSLLPGYGSLSYYVVNRKILLLCTRQMFEGPSPENIQLSLYYLGPHGIMAMNHFNI